MHKQNSRQLQLWLLLLTALSAALLGFVIVWVFGNGSLAASRRELVLGASDAPSPRPSQARDQAPTDNLPTPTFVLTETAALPSAFPSPSGVDEPPTEPPIESAPSQPSTLPSTPAMRPTPQPAPPSTRPPAPVRAEGPQVRLDDSAWAGGYRQARGYAGRSATWVYGSGTEYTTMTAAVTLERQPQGTATLRVEGMDSEGRAKTAIQVSVNGQVIFQGPNPLPDDDQPLESGTWATANWTFDAVLLQPGTNTIRIRNLSPGAFGRPPFFMLDYAVVVVP